MRFHCSSSSRLSLFDTERWELLTRLGASNPQPADRFGRDVALSGDRLLVRAGQSAWLFERDGSDWEPLDINGVDGQLWGLGESRGVSITDHELVVLELD